MCGCSRTACTASRCVARAQSCGDPGQALTSEVAQGWVLSDIARDGDTEWVDLAQQWEVVLERFLDGDGKMDPAVRDPFDFVFGFGRR